MDNALAPYTAADITMVTVTTFGRQPILTGAAAHTWRDVLQRSRQKAARQMLGYVCLADHAHFVVAVPVHLTLDRLVHDVTVAFELAYRQLMGMPVVEPLWQRSYSRRRAQNATDLARFLDYVHYNPVQHGIVNRPEEWPYSSYEEWIERGLYRLGWGWTLPQSIQGRRWE